MFWTGGAMFTGGAIWARGGMFLVVHRLFCHRILPSNTETNTHTLPLRGVGVTNALLTVLVCILISQSVHAALRFGKLAALDHPREHGVNG